MRSSAAREGFKEVSNRPMRLDDVRDRRTSYEGDCEKDDNENWLGEEADHPRPARTHGTIGIGRINRRESAEKAAERENKTAAEVIIRTAISEYLRDCGYKAASVDEAVLVLQQAEITVHIVLSDVEMPGARDGFVLAQWVREHRPTLQVILAGSAARATKAAGELCNSGPMLAICE